MQLVTPELDQHGLLVLEEEGLPPLVPAQRLEERVPGGAAAVHRHVVGLATTERQRERGGGVRNMHFRKFYFIDTKISLWVFFLIKKIWICM